MAFEIERKFLVINDKFKNMATASHTIKQGYLTRRPEGTVRIRIIDNKAKLTIKGKNKGAIRLEFEYEIPLSDGEQMLALCEGTIIDKTRYIIDYEGYIWEVDVFHGAHEGLIVAEVELASSTETPALPPFVGREVTGDAAYYNSNL